MTIRCAFIHRTEPDGEDTLVVWEVGRGGWVEVRGSFDTDENDPLQKVMDSLPGPLVGGELMAGNIATVTKRSYAAAFGPLSRLLESSRIG